MHKQITRGRGNIHCMLLKYLVSFFFFFLTIGTIRNIHLCIKVFSAMQETILLSNCNFNVFIFTVFLIRKFQRYISELFLLCYFRLFISVIESGRFLTKRTMMMLKGCTIFNYFLCRKELLLCFYLALQD